MKTSEQGITLIALIITIIVMLILAGVTINLTLGENGIFTTAQKAAQNYTDAQNKEIEDLNNFTNLVNNTINDLGQSGSSDETNPTLTSQITGADYGKSIDYSVTVKNSSNEDVTLSNWRVFYNDKTTNNVYIILDGYLPNTLIPEEAGMTTKGTYQAYWDTTNFSTNEQAVATLKNTTYWSVFADGVTGATAYGGPTNAMFVNSWNENPAVNSRTLSVENYEDSLTDSSKLYIPYTEAEEGCNGYWLASPFADIPDTVWNVNYHGGVNYDSYVYNPYDVEYDDYGVRPLVCLPSGITGTVGTSVSIDG